MKLVDTGIIAKAEASFCNELSSSMDPAIIGKLFRRHYSMRLSGPMQFEDMNVVVHNNEIAFKFDYTAVAYFSIYMDRTGAFLKMEEQGDPKEKKQEDSDPDDYLLKAGLIRDRATQLAEAIAGEIEEEKLGRIIEINSHAKLNGRLDFMGAQFIVHQNQPIYNLIYQGEVALSFFIDDRGRFLDFADIPETTDKNDYETTGSDKKSYAELEEINIDEERGLIIGEEPRDDIDVEMVDDDELLRLEEIILDDLNDPHRNEVSN